MAPYLMEAFMEATDKLSTEIDKLEVIQDLLSMSNRQGMIDHHALSALLWSIIEKMKEAHSELTSGE